MFRSQSKKKAFTKSCTKWADDLGKKEIEKDLNQIKKYCSTVRVIVHTQMKLLRRRQKKAHIMEVQLNGSSIVDKVNWAREHFEKEILVGQVFSMGETLVGIVRSCPVKLTRVCARWPVSGRGIPAGSSTPCPGLDKRVTITGARSTRRSTAWELASP